MIVFFSPDTFNFLDIGTVNKLVLTKLDEVFAKQVLQKENE